MYFYNVNINLLIINYIYMPTNKIDYTVYWKFWRQDRLSPFRLFLCVWLRTPYRRHISLCFSSHGHLQSYPHPKGCLLRECSSCVSSVSKAMWRLSFTLIGVPETYIRFSRSLLAELQLPYTTSKHPRLGRRRQPFPLPRSHSLPPKDHVSLQRLQWQWSTVLRVWWVF